MEDAYTWSRFNYKSEEIILQPLILFKGLKITGTKILWLGGSQMVTQSLDTRTKEQHYQPENR